MKRRVRFAKRLFERSRIARTVFMLAALPAVSIADWVRGVDAPNWRRGMQWARDGKYAHEQDHKTVTEPERETP
ncbi:hypothetical protein ABZ949_01780 [Micromonospora tulbaghiae]|uniref:hypothetical protein n=1 Tax=Micromonospora tulbaghiae TaxID=479978 RepID=UPI0034016ECB